MLAYRRCTFWHTLIGVRHQELATFGFRGEALSALCSLADVSVVTRTAEDGAGARLSFDHHGKLMSQQSAARAVGTTVSIRDLFKTLPVRHKVCTVYNLCAKCVAKHTLACLYAIWLQEFRRNLKREFAKLLTTVYAYGIISTGVRIICTNQVPSMAYSKHC